MAFDLKKFKATIDGEEPSWYDSEDDIDGYTTNFGTMTIHRETDEIDFACLGFGRNHNNTRMIVQIDGREFQVIKQRGNSAMSDEVSSLSSQGYQYKRKGLSNLEVTEILEMLERDDNNSVAAIIVKKALITSMKANLKFTQAENQALKRLFNAWRKPIITTSIITRTPIITGGK